MREFTITLSNRPGQLARLAKLLADHGVHLESLAAVAVDGDSIVRFLPQEPGLARQALREAGIAFDEHPVLDMFVHGDTDALVDLTEQLAAAEVNIESMYLLHTNAEGRHFALIVDDTEKARERIGS